MGFSSLRGEAWGARETGRSQGNVKTQNLRLFILTESCIGHFGSQRADCSRYWHPDHQERPTAQNWPTTDSGYGFCPWSSCHGLGASVPKLRQTGILTSCILQILRIQLPSIRHRLWENTRNSATLVRCCHHYRPRGLATDTAATTDFNYSPCEARALKVVYSGQPGSGIDCPCWGYGELQGGQLQ